MGVSSATDGASSRTPGRSAVKVRPPNVVNVQPFCLSCRCASASAWTRIVSAIMDSGVGESPVEGEWVDRIVGLEGIRVDTALMETPDGNGRLELVKFHAPSGAGGDRD